MPSPSRKPSSRQQLYRAFPLLLGVVEAGVGLTEQLLILGLAVGASPTPMEADTGTWSSAAS